MYEFVLYERLEVDPVSVEETVTPQRVESPVIKELSRCSGEADEVAMFLRAIADRLSPFRPPSPIHRRTVNLRPDLTA
jgi:hypothetical protein